MSGAPSVRPSTPGAVHSLLKWCWVSWTGFKTRTGRCVPAMTYRNLRTRPLCSPAAADPPPRPREAWCPGLLGSGPFPLAVSVKGTRPPYPHPQARLRTPCGTTGHFCLAVPARPAFRQEVSSTQAAALTSPERRAERGPATPASRRRPRRCPILQTPS